MVKKKDIFSRLNLNISKVLTSSKQSPYLKGYINNMITLDEELEKILSNNNLTLDEKQKSLEKLSEINQSFEMELRYNVPKSLSLLINEIDNLLLEDKNFSNEDISFLLPSVLAAKLGNDKFTKKTYKTAKLKKTLTNFKVILRVFKYMNNSFGLFLVYNLVTFLRSGFDNDKLKKSIEEKKPVKKIVFLEHNHKIENSQVKIEMKRIEMTEKLGKQLLDSFLRLRNACVYHIEKLKFKSQSKGLDKEAIDLLNVITQTEYVKFEFETEEIVRLGIQCVAVLEAANILVDVGEVFEKKNSKSSVIKIDTQYADEIFSIPSRPKKLPMVVRPNFWKKSDDSSTGNLNYGGYQFNKILNYPAILNHHKKGVTVITNEDLKNINFLQSNYYTINNEFLDYIESNFKQIAFTYLRKIADIKFVIQEDKNDSSKIILNTMEDLLANDSELSNLLKNYEKNPENKSIAKQISFRQHYLSEQYQNVVNIFFGLIQAFIVADNYKFYKFYFTVFIDGRGRVYYNSAGAAFGLQTGDFSKALIDLSGNNYDLNNPIKNNKKYSSKNTAYLDYCKSLTKEKEPFQLSRTLLKNLPTTISNDASCSGTSILSGLVGFKKGLLLTNVVTDKITESQYNKECIYNHFLSMMDLYYPDNIFDLYTSEDSIYNKSKKLKMQRNEFVEKVEEILPSIKKILLKREHAKQFVMRKNYAESDTGRRSYIYDNVILPAFYLNGKIVLEKDERIYRSISYYLAIWIKKLYLETFPEISVLCNFLVSHFEETNPIVLACPNNSDFQYQQLEYRTVKVPRPSFKKKRNSDLSIHIRTNKPDFQKIQRSLVANFIHYLDSRLNFLVLDKCRTNKIILWANHDCFYVCPTKKSILLEFYFDSFIELLVKEDTVEYFLKTNSIEPSDSFKNLLEEYKKNRYNILESIDKKELIMSKFILTS